MKHVSVNAPSPLAQRARGSAGFTMIELAVGMVIMGILMGLAAPAWSNYQANQERVSASHQIVSVFRTAQIRATAEEATYRVDVDATAKTLTVFRYDGAAYQKRSTAKLDGSRLVLTPVGFTDKAGVTTTSAYFYARGTASPGKVEVSREGRPKKHVITVEGLTGRVSST